MVGNEPHPLRRGEDIVVPGTEIVDRIPLPAEGAEHLVARADIGGTDDGVSVDVGVRTFGPFAARAAHVVRRGERAEGTHEIVVAPFAPFAVFTDGNIFFKVQNAPLEPSLCFSTLVQKNADAGPIANNRGVKQANFIVLWKCTMPAVLIELGFISNPNDMKVLTDKNSQQRIATNIFKAFQAYKKSYDTDIYLPSSDAPAPAQQATGNFGIQILASPYLLPKDAKEFKGWNCRHIRSGKNYKYYVGQYSTREEALKALPGVRNSFPEAFIIKTDQ